MVEVTRMTVVEVLALAVIVTVRGWPLLRVDEENQVT